MRDMLSSMLLVFVILVLSWTWKVFCWVFLYPKKLEKNLKIQGIKGCSYKILYGDLKEMVNSTKEASYIPMELSHHITPRVIPYIHQMVEKYGKVSLLWFGPIPRLVIMDASMIRDVLSNKLGHFVKNKSIPLSRLLATGLASYEGEKWAKHRRIITLSFQAKKMKMMFVAFDTSCTEMINSWLRLITRESLELDVWPHLQKLTADIISRAVFGSSYKQGKRIFQLQDEQVELLIQATQSIYVPGYRFFPTRRHNRMKRIYKEVQTILKDMIHKRETNIKIGERQNDDLLGTLLEANVIETKDNRNSKNVGIKVEDVIEECKVIYFAGKETTSSLLVWTMIVLSMHPDWQDKAREEVYQVFGKSKPDFEGMSRLKVVTMILYEVMRLYSPVPVLIRATQKTITLGKFILPPGVQVAIPTLLVHRDREFWGEDADEFNPERFSRGVHNATKNQVSFLPFGWGPRNCIGQSFALTESKVAITMILQHFIFKLSSSYVHSPFQVITLEPQHGAPLILYRI